MGLGMYKPEQLYHWKSFLKWKFLRMIFSDFFYVKIT